MNTHSVGPFVLPAAGASIALLALVLGGCHNMHRQAPVRAVIIAPTPCADINFPIYFEPHSAVVTRQAESLMAAAADRSKGCQVTGIVVVGLADAPGSPDANLVLSRRRADAVTRALHRRGFNAVEFRQTASGASGAVTGSGEAKPLRRRADVSIHLAPS